jgi:putative peptidoglycan lipid II flippase
VIALGNVASRLLGLVRETVKSYYFGAGAAVDAYGVATLVPRMLYDLLIGGMVNGALVPVFSAIAEENRGELWRLVSALLNLTVLVLSALALVGGLFALPLAAFLMAGESDPAVLALAARMLRWTIPAVVLLSISGVLSGLLYALKRFTLPAFTAAIFNAGIIAFTLAFHRQLDVTSMALGLLAGALLQVLLQLPGLRDTGVRLSLRLWHPGMRRVLLLYAPSMVPIVFDVLFSRPVSVALVSLTGEGGISYLNYATFLTQLPQGLVATAVSLAVLPSLSAQASGGPPDQSNEPFKQTLARGLRMVMVLIIPAAVGLYLLAEPVIDLLFENGGLFIPQDTLMTAWALRFYLIGLPFAAVDLLLVFAFYARQDTVTPALIGIGTIVAYLLLAAGLLPAWGLFSLMIADSFKHFFHTLLSALFLGRQIGGMRGHGLYRILWRTLFASAVMGIVVYASLAGVMALFPAREGWGEWLAVLVPGGLGIAVFLALAAILRLEEVHYLWTMLRRKLTG